MFFGNDEHPDIWRHLDDWLAFSVFIWKMKIMQTQCDYKPDGNKQIFDNVHRIPNIWVQNWKFQLTIQMFGII